MSHHSTAANGSEQPQGKESVISKIDNPVMAPIKKALGIQNTFAQEHNVANQDDAYTDGRPGSDQVISSNDAAATNQGKGTEAVMSGMGGTDPHVHHQGGANSGMGMGAGHNQHEKHHGHHTGSGAVAGAALGHHEGHTAAGALGGAAVGHEMGERGQHHGHHHGQHHIPGVQSHQVDQSSGMGNIARVDGQQVPVQQSNNISSTGSSM